jgi:hypothetical protein
MTITYHYKTAGRVTFTATKQNDQYTPIDVALCPIEPPHEVNGIDFHTLDVAKLIKNANGTPFQKAVWMAICQIEPGKTATYGELPN